MSKFKHYFPEYDVSPRSAATAPTKTDNYLLEAVLLCVIKKIDSSSIISILLTKDFEIFKNCQVFLIFAIKKSIWNS